MISEARRSFQEQLPKNDENFRFLRNVIFFRPRFFINFSWLQLYRLIPKLNYTSRYEKLGPDSLWELQWDGFRDIDPVWVPRLGFSGGSFLADFPYTRYYSSNTKLANFALRVTSQVVSMPERCARLGPLTLTFHKTSENLENLNIFRNLLSE